VTVISEIYAPSLHDALPILEAHTGNPSEYMRGMFIHYLQALHGTENRISMASCSKREASDLIDVIITWIFQNYIPLNHKTSDLIDRKSTRLNSSHVSISYAV